MYLTRSCPRDFVLAISFCLQLSSPRLIHGSLPHLFLLFLCLSITFLVRDSCNPVEILKLKLNIVCPYFAFPHSTYYHLAHYIFSFSFCFLALGYEDRYSILTLLIALSSVSKTVLAHSKCLINTCRLNHWMNG